MIGFRFRLVDAISGRTSGQVPAAFIGWSGGTFIDISTEWANFVRAVTSLGTSILFAMIFRTVLDVRTTIVFLGVLASAVRAEVAASDVRAVAGKATTYVVFVCLETEVRRARKLDDVAVGTRAVGPRTGRDVRATHVRRRGFHAFRFIRTGSDAGDASTRVGRLRKGQAKWGDEEKEWKRCGNHG